MSIAFAISANSLSFTMFFLHSKLFICALLTVLSWCPTLNKLVDSTQKPDESYASSNAFDKLKQNANIPTQIRDALENLSNSEI